MWAEEGESCPAAQIRLRAAESFQLEAVSKHWFVCSTPAAGGASAISS